MTRLWRKYNLVVVLSALCLLFLAIQAVLQYQDRTEQARLHGSHLTLTQFAIDYGASVFGRWAAGMFQLALFVALSSRLVFAGSPQSKSEREKLEHKVDDVREKVEGE